ncbi:uncharacterized protein METZ01_LOCUS315404, partial [marine metagenome]
MSGLLLQHLWRSDKVQNVKQSHHPDGAAFFIEDDFINQST